MRKMFTNATIRAFVLDYVKKAKQAGDFELTRENVAGLIDKIAKVVLIPQNYNDKLPELEGEYLGLGKTIEEVASDLILPEDFDPEGTNALKPSDPTYRAPSYSQTLGKKTFKTTKRKNNLNRACLTEEGYAELVSDIITKLYDSSALFRYAMKRQILGNFITKAIEAQTTATEFAVRTAYSIGTYLKKPGEEVRGVIFKAVAVENAKEWDALVTEGYIVPIDLVTTIAKPVDTATGEAFIEQLKKDVEIASDVSEGHSLNGGTLGASNESGLRLYVLQGVMPNLEVHTESGAFHVEKLAIPATKSVIKDFGNADSNVYAVLIDPRGVKLHPTWIDGDDDKNGEGGFTNFYIHTENTAFISKNTFIKVYKGA